MPQKICLECGGSLKKKTITQTQPCGDELYRFEHVPALFGIMAPVAFFAVLFPGLVQGAKQDGLGNLPGLASPGVSPF